MATQRPTATRESRQIPPRRVLPPREDEFGKAFHHLCHLVSLSRTGKMKSAVENLVNTTIGLCSDPPLTSADGVVEAVQVFFGIDVPPADVQRVLDAGVAAKWLIRARGTGAVTLGAATRAEVEGRGRRSHELEAAVRSEWSIELLASGLAVDEAEVGKLWCCLRSYMARAFRQHGAMAVQLLDATVPVEEAGQESLGTFMDEAICEEGQGLDREHARAAISSFFKTTTPDRARYVAQLLDATFTFFALTGIDAAGDYLSRSLSPLALFLDTNYIFGLLGIHENPLSEASKELISFVRSNGFPFTMYVHERTVREIEATMAAVSDRLLSRRWTPDLSRAAVATHAGTGVELSYHRLNAQSPVDPKVYLSKFDHVVDLLADFGVQLYRVTSDEGYSVEEKGALIAEYEHFVNKWRPGKPKPYDAIDHDITVWLTLRTKRNKTKSALDAGALFLTNDFLFRSFDWRVLRKSDIGSVVLPGQLLQVLRPFARPTEDFDRRFFEAFAAPEFRSAQTGYESTASQVLSFLATYKDVPEKTAVRILTNEMLMLQLKDTEADSEEFKELVESVLVQDNAILLEEREALARQIEEDRLRAEHQLSAVKSELADRDTELEQAKAAAEESINAARTDEEQRRQQEREALAAASKLIEDEAAEHATRAESVAAEFRRFKRRLRLAVAVLVAVAGGTAILVVPHLANWHWLHANAHRTGLYACALLIWAGGAWTFGEPEHYKGALGLVALGAVLVAIPLL